MASQKVTITKNYQKTTKTTKITKIKRTKNNDNKKSGRHATADCCVHKYHNK